MTFGHIGLHQTRQTGQINGVWKNAVKNGRANYVTGYHPVFAVAKFLKRLFVKPYIIEAIGILYGFISSYIYGNVKQIADKELIRYVRKQQINKLLFRSTVWK